MLRVLRRCLLLIVALCVTSCLSPTLPLPPPDRPDVSVVDSGIVRLQGLAAPRTEVIAWNRSNDLIAGQVTGEDARYDFTIQGAAGDSIDLWYLQGGEESPTVRVTVPTE
jgi:hypothetical protein